MPPIEKRFYQCQQIWAVLALAAAEGHALTYKELGDRVGIFHRHLNRHLGIIKQYCKSYGLPHLNAICVAAKTELPSDPEYGDHAPKFLAAALGYDWSRQSVSPRDFAMAEALAGGETRE
jgi:hypothetical protein